MPNWRCVRLALAKVRKRPGLASKVRLLRYPSWADWLRGLAPLFIAVRDHTMLSRSRLTSLCEAVRRCNRARIPGAVVECGVWKGGSAGVLIAQARHRPVWLFDSFDGCPDPSPDDVSAFGRPGERGECKASSDALADLLHALRLDRSNVRVCFGWFAETLPAQVPRIGQIAVLHLDGDWYESTKTCLTHLFPLVSPGGYIQIDDFYYWKGAERAVREYFSSQHVPLTFTRIDHTAIRIHKEH